MNKVRDKSLPHNKRPHGYKHQSCLLLWAPQMVRQLGSTALTNLMPMARKSVDCGSLNMPVFKLYKISTRKSPQRDNIRKIASRVAGVAPRFSSKPHPATLCHAPTNNGGDIIHLVANQRTQSLVAPQFDHILWGHELSSELFLHTAQIKITILYYYAISLQKQYIVQM